MPQPFSAVIYKLGINPCVDIPAQVSQAFGRKGPIPVRGLLNQVPIRATLVPTGQDRYRLFINGEMRKQAQVEVGDEVQIELEFDEAPRTIPMPEAFVQALAHNPAARAAFESRTASRRKDILLYLNSLKRTETLEKAIERVIESMLEADRKLS